ncbi:hypothetical protein BTM25_20330 [Actinomadura rubteroloni]|uniref:Uncharacterized protein n=1 Tax=Actinomadura rubteroloni TaxID=1926885 RepID=A0A2P4URE6_9ACTN|nr:hypothetical protein [Actinomadura rubteroloni]POM27617.1 hypothetical protein BTM25_20330 [Actinomadura rubteroloni]
MSLDKKRWAQRAQALKFTQLDGARKQAEAWRTGLGGLTALLGAVLIVKGRDNVTALTPGFRWFVVVLIGVALVLLVTATLLAMRAAAGSPGADILLSGESLQAWTADEVKRASRAIRSAAWLTTAAVACLAVGIGATWLGPLEKPEKSLMEVLYAGGRACGEIGGADKGQLIVREARRPVVVPLATVQRMRAVASCG